MGKTDCSVGKNQADVDSNQRTTTSKNEAHKSTDTFVALHPSPIIDPDDGKILHIMKHLEECDADEDILHSVVAVPPEGNAAEQERIFTGLAPRLARQSLH